MMTALLQAEIDPRTLISKPTTIKQESFRIHRFVFGGFMWAFVDGDTDYIESDVKEHFIDRDGEMKILAQPVTEIEYMMSSMKTLFDQGKLGSYGES
jgi:hypothetical protein